MRYLSYWLLIVAATSLFATINGYFNPTLIKERQFSARQDDASDLACRLFSVWTLLATVVRAICAFHLEEKGIYMATVGSFFIALGFYTAEAFVFKTVDVVYAIPPFCVATSSLVWMLFLHKPSQRPKSH